MVLDDLTEIFAMGAHAPEPDRWLGERDPIWGQHHQAASVTSAHNATEIGWHDLNAARSLVRLIKDGQSRGYRDAETLLTMLAHEPGRVMTTADIEDHLQLKLASGALNVLGRAMVTVFGTKNATDARCRAYPWKWWQTPKGGSVYAMRPLVAVVLVAADLLDGTVNA